MLSRRGESMPVRSACATAGLAPAVRFLGGIGAADSTAARWKVRA